MRMIRCVTMVAAWAPGALAQAPARLRCVVMDGEKKQPIAGAEALIPSRGLTATSDAEGVFRFRAVPPGKQTISVRRVGYPIVSSEFTIVPGDTIDCVFTLVKAEGTVLPEVEVTTSPVSLRLVEFDQRRKAGFGHFLTAADIAKRPSTPLAEILSNIPGVYVARGSMGRAYLTGNRGAVTFSSSGRGALDACRMPVMIDEVLVFAAVPGGFNKASSEPAFDISTIEPSNIAGIEIYSGGATVPAKYGGTRNNCGLVLIWTK